MIAIEPMPAGGTVGRPVTASRLTERHVLPLGLGLAGLFVAGAGIAAAVASVAMLARALTLARY